MADYRLSAQVISRGKGQSSIASAAYRAAARLNDERTGEIHDFTRKAGVVYSAIVAPEDAPEWMRDRERLWQAVEAVERRKDAQLARELQLSLPHELTQEQRKELLLGFVREQFVNQGMIADVAIHLPGREGDHRNHHAHVMLTMRSLTGDGFGNKVREWNDADTLSQWRERWAHHQNRALERYGHEARVDHRSYEDRGIDREPAQHMGPTATGIERNGKPSRIGDENREREDRNSDRAHDHAQAGVIDLLIERERRQMHQRHGLERIELSADIERTSHVQKQTILRELSATQERLQATGWRKLLRDLTGRTRDDQKHAADLRRVADEIQRREIARRAELQARHEAERRDLERREHAAQQERQQLPREPERPAEAFRNVARDQEPEKPSLRPAWDSVQHLTDRQPWESDLTRSRLPGRERTPGDDEPPKNER